MRLSGNWELFCPHYNNCKCLISKIKKSLKRKSHIPRGKSCEGFVVTFAAILIIDLSNRPLKKIQTWEIDISSHRWQYKHKGVLLFRSFRIRSMVQIAMSKLFLVKPDQVMNILCDKIICIHYNLRYKNWTVMCKVYSRLLSAYAFYSNQNSLWSPT